jgi:hypothetical protein
MRRKKLRLRTPRNIRERLGMKNKIPTNRLGYNEQTDQEFLEGEAQVYTSPGGSRHSMDKEVDVDPHQLLRPGEKLPNIPKGARLKVVAEGIREPAGPVNYGRDDTRDGIDDERPGAGRGGGRTVQGLPSAGRGRGTRRPISQAGGQSAKPEDPKVDEAKNAPVADTEEH